MDSMMGFYLVLRKDRSLEDIAKCLGSVCSCALYYIPSAPVQRGNPCELLAQPEAGSAHLRISVPSFVESDVRDMISAHFGNEPVKLYDLGYTDPGLLLTLAPHFMKDPLVAIIDEADVEAGSDYLSRLVSPTQGGGGKKP